MTRPAMPTKSIVVDSNGKLIVWTDGALSGDQTLIKEIKLSAELKLPVQLSAFGPTVESNLDDVNNLEAVLAAITSVNIGRTRILEAPEELISVIPIFDDVELEEDVQ